MTGIWRVRETNFREDICGLFVIELEYELELKPELRRMMRDGSST